LKEPERLQDGRVLDGARNDVAAAVAVREEDPLQGVVVGLASAAARSWFSSRARAARSLLGDRDNKRARADVERLVESITPALLEVLGRVAMVFVT
jgi:hypothetical protein